MEYRRSLRVALSHHRAKIQTHGAQNFFLELWGEDIVTFELTGHLPLWERADQTHVTTGRLLQVSAQHAIAIALRRGKVGLRTYDDETVSETLCDENRSDVIFSDDTDRAIETAHMHMQTGQEKNFVWKLLQSKAVR